jgi:uncharacterized protein involved in exopolysaccharide biosynthesis
MNPALVLTHTHTEFLMSRTIARKVVGQIIAERDSSEGKTKERTLPGHFHEKAIKPLLTAINRFMTVLNYGSYHPRPFIDRATAKMMNSIQVRNVPGSFIMSITVRWEDPDIAQRAANLLAEIYIDTNRKGNQRSLTQTKEFIETKLRQENAKLLAIEDSIKSFKEQSNVYSLATDIKNKTSELTYYEGEANRLEAKLMELEAKQQGFKNIHSIAESVRIEAEIKSTTRALEKTRQTIEKLQWSLKTIPEVEYRLSELLQERGSVTRTIEGLQENLIRTHIAEAGITSAVRVIDPAVSPVYPSSPKVVFNTLAQTMAALIIALGIAFIMESLRPRLRTPEDLGTMTTLGVLPRQSRHFASLPLLAGGAAESVVRKHHYWLAQQVSDRLDGDGQIVLVDSLSDPSFHLEALEPVFRLLKGTVHIVNFDNNADATMKERVQAKDSRPHSDKLSYHFWKTATPGVCASSETAALEEYLRATRATTRTTFLFAEKITAQTYSPYLIKNVDAHILCVRVNRDSRQELAHLRRIGKDRRPETMCILDDITYPPDFALA